MSGLSALAANTPDDEFEKWIDRTKQLGQGTTRTVYEMHGDDTVVIKEMRYPLPRANLIEWIVWEAVQRMAEDIMGTTPNLSMQNLFAKCYSISASGKFLIMERLSPLEKGDEFHRAKFPDWLNDVKPAAFGKDSAFGKDRHGNVKVMDYAMVNFYEVLNPLNRQGLF